MPNLYSWGGKLGILLRSYWSKPKSIILFYSSCIQQKSNRNFSLNKMYIVSINMSILLWMMSKHTEFLTSNIMILVSHSHMNSDYHHIGINRTKSATSQYTIYCHVPLGGGLMWVLRREIKVQFTSKYLTENLQLATVGIGENESKLCP